MYQAKLFKNGNSIVLAIPEQLRQILHWEAADQIILEPVCIEDTTAPMAIVASRHWSNTKPNRTHARKTTHNPR